MTEAIETTVLYEGIYYLMRETKKPTYLNFYELEEKDLWDLIVYCDQTVRYNDKWFFISMKKTYFSTKERRDAAPKQYIKYLYKKKEPVSQLVK